MPRFKPRVQLYVALFVALAVLLLVSASWTLPPVAREDFQNALVAFAVLAVASEAAFLRLSIGTSTSSVSYIPYLAGLVLLGPAWSMLLAGTAVFFGETIVRRKPPLKITFNVSKEIVSVGAAGWLYVGLGGVPSLSQFHAAPLAFAVAVASFFVLNSGSTAVAIALSSETTLGASLHRLVGTSLLFDLLSTPLALLLGFLYITLGLAGILVVVVPLFLVRHVHAVNLRLEQANRELLELMVKAIEARDPYTSGHSVRVSRTASLLARQLGLSAKQVEEVETAALLHDVGKIHEQYARLLQKEGPLTPEERALMQTHSVRSYELVRTISSFREGLDVAVRHHHENFDGTGYPDGLRGHDIPLGSRIIMVADTVDAMTTDRPYRRALGFDQVVRELQKYSGIQFDPAVVEAFHKSTAVRALLQNKGSVQESLARVRPSGAGIAYVG